MGLTRVSLCMIVKNEEVFLPGCLDSVRGAVDELIVVDTGSTDGTAVIARAHGAAVFHFPWVDDFSAARNESIAHASGDWILYLDADERLAPGSAPEIRRAVEKGDFDCGFLAIYNAARPDAPTEEVLEGTARMDDPVLQRRLFRRTPDLRFTGLVHEHVGGWLAAGERRAKVLPAALIHLGYAHQIVQDRAKLARNTDLLRRQLQRDPADFATYGYLAHGFLLAGEPEPAWEAVERGWTKIDGALALDHPSVVRLVAVRSQLQLSRHDPTGALETLRRGVEVQGDSPDFDFLLGEAHFALGRESQPRQRACEMGLAENAYHAALAKKNWISSARYVAGAAGYRALNGLGQVALHQGRFGEATKFFEASATAAPDWVEPRIGQAKTLIALGDEESLLALLKTVEGTVAESLVTSLVAEQLGLLDVFDTLLDQARQAQDQNPLSVGVWEELYTRYQRLAAYRGQPSGGDGLTGAICALLAGERPARSPGWMGEFEKVDCKLLVKNLVRFGQGELLERLRTSKAEAALPGICALVEETLADTLRVECQTNQATLASA